MQERHTEYIYLGRTTARASRRKKLPQFLLWNQKEYSMIFIIYFLQAFEIASKVWLSAWASSREESKVGVST